MPGTFQAVAVIVAGVLPGALYVWAFERQVGRWGIGLADRVLRFVGTSAVLRALIAPLTYASYRELFASGALRRADALPAWSWPAILGYVGIPSCSGRSSVPARGGSGGGRHMAKNPGRRTSRSTRLTRGGYTSGSKTVSELKPPPKGRAVGVKKTRSR